MSNRQVYVMMVFSSLLTSGAYITGKYSVAQFPPFALTFYRFLIASVLIFIVLRIREPDNWLLKREQFLSVLILGTLGIFMYHSLFFLCLKYTTAINSSLIAAANPMLTAVIALLLFGESITLFRASGIIVSFSGVVMTVTNGDWRTLTSMSFNYGDLIMFLAVCCWAGYSVLSRRVMQKHDISPLKLTTYCFLFCLVESIPFFLWERPMSYISETTVLGWGSIIYMAVFSSVLAYLFYSIAIQKVGASRAAIFANLVPVFTIILALLILGEPFGWVKFLSALTIIVGVYITTRPDKVPKSNQMEKQIC